MKDFTEELCLFNPLALAIISGATFVARAYAGDMAKLTEIIVEANKHKGLSVIDILQPCVTFNKVCTHAFYRENIYYLEEGYNPSDKQKALERASEFGEKKIPLGIFYKSDRPSYEENISQIKEKPLIEIPVDRATAGELFKKYT